MTPRIDMPDAIVIPTSAAATLHFVGNHLSARDIAFAVTVAWLAANRPDVAIPVPGSTDLYDIPDNGVRQAIGLGRRQSADKEAGRHERFAKSAFHVAGMDWAMPILASMHPDNAHPMRAKNLDMLTLRWKISPSLIKALRVVEGEPTVALPMRLIQRARSRYTLPMMAWVGSWFQGHLDPEFLHKIDDHSVVIRIKPDDLLDMLWMGRGLPVANIVRDVLQPIADEIEAYGDHVMAIEPRRTKYKGGRVGKIQDIQIGFHRFVTDSTVESFDDRVRRLTAQRIVAAEQAAIDAEKKPSRNWRRPVLRPGTRKQPELQLEDVSNVVALPIDKIRPAFVQDPKPSRIGFVMPPGQSTKDPGDDDVF